MPSAAPAAPAAPVSSPSPAAHAWHEAVLFMARFLGTSVQAERLRASLAARGPTADAAAVAQLLGHAHLVGSRLDDAQPRRATELPALLLNDEGRALVVLALRDDGQFECHVPGIAGSSWLSPVAVNREVPNGHWWAVRPELHFDQRSLLYSLPEAGRWFWDVFNRNRWVFRWALLGTFVLNIFGALIPFYAMAVYDRVIPNNAMGSLWVLTVAVVLLMGFELTLRLLRSNLVEVAARRMDVALSSRIFAQCLRLRAASRPASGGTLANTVRDFESVREFFASSTLTALGDIPFLVLYLVVIALVGGWLVLVPLAAIPLLLASAWFARGPLARHVAESMQESAQRTAHLFETMNGLDTVKALGAEAWSRRKWESLSLAIAHNSLETREVVTRVNYINTTVLALSGAAVVAVGAVMMGDHLLTLGQIIAVSLLSSRALAPVSQVASLIVRWEQTKLSYEATNKIMEAETDDSPSSLQAPPLTGAVEFRDVGFAYPHSPALLERLNLKIRPGEKVGVIGKLGSGKSTLLRLLLNQYAPASGSVLVDELATTQLEPLSLRRQIGYVPQDVTLFHGTLRENIELGRTQSDDTALLQAMKLACLDDIVAQLPAGVGTQVGERGERLSGGQRQSVAIARALLAQPKLLLLDEPSSMFDPGTEQRLITRLRTLKDTSIVLVTHRMAMLALVDRLVVFDRGRVVADGPRDAVLQALSQRPAEDMAAAAANMPAATGSVPAAPSPPSAVAAVIAARQEAA
jgi:ATP-binding cassette subfamily C protein LapB